MLQFSVTVLLIVNVIIEYLLLMVDIPSGMTLPGKLLQYFKVLLTFVKHTRFNIVTISKKILVKS